MTERKHIPTPPIPWDSVSKAVGFPVDDIDAVLLGLRAELCHGPASMRINVVIELFAVLDQWMTGAQQPPKAWKHAADAVTRALGLLYLHSPTVNQLAQVLCNKVPELRAGEPLENKKLTSTLHEIRESTRAYADLQHARAVADHHELFNSEHARNVAFELRQAYEQEGDDMRRIDTLGADLATEVLRNTDGFDVHGNELPQCGTCEGTGQTKDPGQDRETCSTCEGTGATRADDDTTDYGYDVFTCESPDHTPVELQADQDSKRFQRPDGSYDDDAAAVQFVRDLQRGDKRAQRLATQLIDEGDTPEKPMLTGTPGTATVHTNLAADLGIVSGVTATQNRVLCELWDATDAFAESSEVRDELPDEHARLVAARDKMGEQFSHLRDVRGDES